MKYTAVLLGAVLSGCPYDAASAGLRQVDGGYTYETGDGGTGFIPAVIDGGAYGPDILPKAPSMQTLCTLFIGDMSDSTDYPHRTGTWIGDAIRLIGPPPRNGIELNQDEGLLTYQWSGDDGKTSGGDGMELTFEYVPVQYKGDNGGPPHGYFEQSYWLHGIKLRSNKFYDCWRWDLKDPGHVDCQDCIDLSQFDRSCLADAPHGDPRNCF